MKRLLLLPVFLVAAVASAQLDPRLQNPVELVNTVTPTTSSPYAIITSNTNETVHFQITSPDAGTGSVIIEASIDDENSVRLLTNQWVELYNEALVGVMIFIEDPPPYIRVRALPTAGTLVVKVRGNGTRFRKVN